MRVVIAGITVLGLCITACTKQAGDAAPPTAASADQFISEVNAELLAKQPQWSAAAWVAATYITDDTQRLSAAATEQSLEFDSRTIETA